jgi:MFS superfamily sulfate permease-like transporter
LPSLEVPVVHAGLLLALLPAALVMALIGFMEATSISKAIATSTGERVNTNKELIGQGLANIAGSFFSAFTVSGSFSRSAVAARTGARTACSRLSARSPSCWYCCFLPGICTTYRRPCLRSS